MKRSLYLLPVFVLAVLVLCGSRAPGEDPQAPVSSAPPSSLPAVPSVSSDGTAGTTRVPVPPKLGKLDLVSELVAILNETKSLDTFMVTLRMLENMGPAAEPAIPAILRNAERLGLFRDYLTAKEGKSDWVEAVAKSLDRIRRKETAEPPSTSSPFDAKPVSPVPIPQPVPYSSPPSKSKDAEHPPK